MPFEMNPEGFPKLEGIDVLRLAPESQLNGHASAPSVELLSGASIQPEPVRWLWKGWLALGKIALLAGAPGTGKSTLALEMAATVTIGGTMPDGESVQAGDVLVWSGEDDPADTLLPRFLAAGGNPERIYFVNATVEHGQRVPFDPARDLPRLAETVQRLARPLLIILDPIVSAVPGDSHKNAEARRGLQPVADLAAKTGAAVLGVTHFAKSSAGREPQERVNGSIAFAALPRIVLATVKPALPGAPRRLVRAKSNLGPDHGGFEYSLYQAAVPGFDFGAQRVQWGQLLEGSARELMAVEEMDDGADAAADAETFLRDTLKDGPVATRELKAAAEAHGHSWATIRRTQAALGIVAAKAGFKGGWTWQLPPEGAQ
jgi:hypothetical protein